MGIAKAVLFVFVVNTENNPFILTFEPLFDRINIMGYMCS